MGKNKKRNKSKTKNKTRFDNKKQKNQIKENNKKTNIAKNQSKKKHNYFIIFLLVLFLSFMLFLIINSAINNSSTNNIKSDISKNTSKVKEENLHNKDKTSFNLDIYKLHTILISIIEDNIVASSNKFISIYKDRAFKNADIAKKLKVIILHSVGDDANYTVISPEKFENLLKKIQEKNYTTISQKQLLYYVYFGIELPEKPLILTFDDGYYNNYEIAFKLLKKYKQKASIFLIGASNGKDKYKDTDIEINRHIGYKEINEMLESGLIDIGSHSYNMHSVAKYEPDNEYVRETSVMLPNENFIDYEKALIDDCKKFRKEFAEYEKYGIYAFSYPLGEHNDLAEYLFYKQGFLITYSIYSGDNYIYKNKPDSLFLLNRYVVEENTDLDSILE